MSKKNLIISIMSIALNFFQPLSAGDKIQKLTNLLEEHKDEFGDNGRHVCQAESKSAADCINRCDDWASTTCLLVECGTEIGIVTDCLEGISSFPEPSAPIVSPIPMPNPFDQRQISPKKDGYLEIEYKEHAAKSVAESRKIQVNGIECGTKEDPCIGHGGAQCTVDDIVQAEVAWEDFHADKLPGLLTGVARNTVHGVAPYACSAKEITKNTTKKPIPSAKKQISEGARSAQLIQSSSIEKPDTSCATPFKQAQDCVASCSMISDDMPHQCAQVCASELDGYKTCKRDQDSKKDSIILEESLKERQKKQTDARSKISLKAGYSAGDMEKQMAHQASEFNQARQKLGAAIKDAFVLVPTGAGSYKSEIRTERDIRFYNAVEQFSKMGDGIGSAISLFGGDKRTAHTVQAATVGLAKTAMSFYTGDIFGVLSGLNMLKGAFAKPDQSNQLMMRELFAAVQDLSRQMAANQEQIMYCFARQDKRFDRIDEKLDDQKRLIIQEFFNLHKETGDIKKAIEKLATQAAEYHAQLQSNVAYTTQRMESGHATLVGSLFSLRLEDINEDIANALEDADRKELSEKDFDHHTKQLTRKATTRAAEPHLTGGNIEITDLPAIQAALKTNSKKLWDPAFANVNLLSKYAAHRCKMPHSTLVNPLIWTQCADTVLTLFHKKLVDGNYPSTKEQHMLDMQRLHNLIKEGEKITDWPKTLDKAGVVQEVCKDYLQKLDQLAAVIQKRRAEYETERALETREKQRKMIEADIAAVNTIPIEAPGYMAATTAWRNCLLSMSDGVCRGIRFDGTCDPKPLQAEVMHGSVVRTGDLGRELIPIVDEHLSLLHKASRSLNGIDRIESGARLIYPATRYYKFPLLVHAAQLPEKFRENGQDEIGDERLEYYIHDNAFYLCKYICEENGTKHLIGRIKMHYAPVSLYNNDENVRHFWYGGNYPRDKDSCGIWVDGKQVATGHYPPLAPYGGARYGLQSQTVEIFEETRQLLKEKKKMLDEQERVKFCKRVAAESQPSFQATFKAIQDLDVQFKLLNGYLDIMYNEAMYEPHNPEVLRAEFAVLRDSKVTYLKDSDALTRYFEEYSKPSTELAKQEFALQHIKQTQETIEKTFQGILGLKLKAQFGQIVNVLDGLRELTARYRGRIITPIKIDTESQELVLALKQVAQKDKQIAEQHKHIEALSTVVTETRNEIQEMRKQMQLMMEMMSKMQKT